MPVSRHLDVLMESWRTERAAEKTKRKLDETAFLPAALEVLETPPNPLGRIVLWALIAFVGIALVWACVGRIDMVASAQGKLVPAGRVKIIQAADAGVVRAIHVQDGQKVRAGDPLISLDPTASEAEAEQARQSLFVAAIDRARAQALVAAASDQDAAFVAPEGAASEIVALQEKLVAARVAEHRTALEALEQERAQRRGDLAMVSAEVAKLEAQLPLVEDQLLGMRTLEGKGFAPRLRVAEVEERAIGMRQDLVIRREERAKARAALAGIEQEIAQRKSEFAATALDALSEAEANYRLRAEEVKKAEDKARLAVLRAPIDGVVAQLSVHTIGGVVKPADPLLLVVPRVDEGENALIVEAMVLNKDKGFVREGQPVEVKLEAYPFTRYGIIEGVVERISSDAVEDEKQGLIFPARVKLSQPWIMIGAKKTLLAPGLSATAEIKTGQRRIIEYLLSPLQRRVSEAGRER